MRPAKDEGKGNAPSPEPGPPGSAAVFERFKDFARSITVVPESELKEQERTYRRRKRTGKRRG